MSAFDEMLARAQQAVGVRYVWGGNSLSKGVDCSGFTQQVFASIGIQLPRVSNQQAKAGTPVSKDQAQPGDLVWWDLNGRNVGADHIGIYLGNGMVIEASSSQGKVVVRKLWGNAQFTRPTGAPPGGFTANAQGQPQPMPPAQVNVLAQLIDPADLGETEATVGAYNFARIMVDKMQDMADIGKERDVLDAVPEPEPALPADAEDYSLAEQTGRNQEFSQVTAFREQEGMVP